MGAFSLSFKRMTAVSARTLWSNSDRGVYATELFRLFT